VLPSLIVPAASAPGEHQTIDRRRAALGLAVSVALTLLVRLPFLSWPLTVDEGSYAYTAHWWFGGLTLYSADLWFDRPQAIFLAYEAGMRLLGESTLAIRLWGALWAAVSTYGAYLIAFRLWGQRAAWGALVLSAIFCTAPHIEGFTANGELFMLAPAILSAYCLLTRRWAWAGALASLAFLLKPSGVMAVVLGVAWLGCVRAGWRDWLGFAVAAAPLPILSLLHAALTIGIGPYLDAIIWYRLGVNVASGYQPEGPALDGWVRTLSVWGPLLLPAAAALSQLRGRALAFVCLWLATSVAGIAIGGHWLMHYFAQLVLPLAALAGAGVVFLVAEARLAIRWVTVPVLAWGLIVFLSSEVWYAAMPAAVASNQLYRRPGYLIGEEVGAYLRAHTTSDDRLYVAFYEAETYQLGGLRSTTPYLFRLDLEQLPGAFDSVVRGIENRAPTYVLDLKQGLDPRLDTQRFYRALTAAYVPEKNFAGAVLYHRNPPQQAAPAGGPPIRTPAESPSSVQAPPR
jgi:4-amino-4-deoxy-L-arabinose transferase-like glycosyltransferase